MRGFLRYGGDEVVPQQLKDTLHSTLDLSVAAAALEALTCGWLVTSELTDLHDAAFASREPTLRFVGISGRVSSGRADQSDRDCIVELLSEFPDIDYWDRPAARMLLSQNWPDDQVLIDKALRAVQRNVPRRDQFERESAMHYLIRSSPTNPMVADWVRAELKQQYPFSMAHDDIWDCVGPFAIEHPDIRASVIACIRSEFGRHSLHYFQSLIVKLGGDDLRDELIGIARTGDHRPGFWAVQPLLDGWGRSDPTVELFLDEIASWDNQKVGDLADLLPRILTDFDVCRARLLSLARVSERPRFDLIARGFAILGCTAEDTEVVDSLLAAVNKGAPLFDPGTALLTHFSANPRVKQYELQTLSGREPPLGVLASVFENDAEVRPRILGYSNPLPVTLRADIAEAASGGGSRPTLECVLEVYDIEVDAELKIAASINYHRDVARRSAGPSKAHLDGLFSALHAVGPDLHERRAAALAGMILLGRVNDIVPMAEYGGKPLHMQYGKGYGRESDSLMVLICERWDDMHKAFGADLPSRFGEFGADEGQLWDCLAPHINESLAARRDFLAFCEKTNTTPGLRSFIALAKERPNSELLLDQCWRVLGREVTGQYERHSAWAVERIHLEIAYILRDHFREREDVKERLREALKRGQRADVVALALVDPNDPLLDLLRYGPKEIAFPLSE